MASLAKTLKMKRERRDENKARRRARKTRRKLREMHASGQIM